MSQTVPVLGAVTVSAPAPSTARHEPAVLLELLDAVRPDAADALMAWQWRRGRAEPAAGETIRLEAVVTRCLPGAGGSPAMVHQALRLLGAGGRDISSGTAAWRLPVAVPPQLTAVWTETDPCSVGWGRAMQGRLNSDGPFGSATRGFDGSIGLMADSREVHLRVYRGSVIDVAANSVGGCTFAVLGSDLAWVELITGDRNDYVRRTSAGQFRCHGSSFQYLRMFKAVMLVIEEARVLWRGARHAYR